MDEAERHPEPGVSAASPGGQLPEKKVDWDAALDVAAGEVDLLLDVLDAFRIETSQTMRSLHESLETQDATLLHRAAHTAKNAFYNIGARATGDIAFELEKLGKAANFEEVPSLLEQLDAHAQQINQEVDQYRREKGRA